jgi:hypothetical protein
VGSTRRHGDLQILNITLDEGAFNVGHLGWPSGVSDTVVVRWGLAPCNSRWICNLNCYSDPYIPTLNLKSRIG